MARAIARPPLRPTVKVADNPLQALRQAEDGPVIAMAACPVAAATRVRPVEWPRPRGSPGEPLAALTLASKARRRTAAVGACEADPGVQVAPTHSGSYSRSESRGRRGPSRGQLHWRGAVLLGAGPEKAAGAFPALVWSLSVWREVATRVPVDQSRPENGMAMRSCLLRLYWGLVVPASPRPPRTRSLAHTNVSTPQTHISR